MKRGARARVALIGGVLSLLAFASPALAEPRLTFASLAEGRVPIPSTDDAQPTASGPGDDLSVQIHNITVPTNRRTRLPVPAPPAQRTELRITSMSRCLVATPTPSPSPSATTTTSTRAMQAAMTFVPESGVKSLRSERLVVGNDGAKLEITDFTIDTASLRVATRARAEVKLTKVEGGPGGFAVYGFRHDGVFEVVVPRGASMNVAASGLPSDDVRCGHARVPLDAAGGGMAAFFSGTFSRTMPATWPRPHQPVPGRSWQVQVAASSSKTSRDREPVLSVTVTSQRPDDEEPTAANEGAMVGGRVMRR